jgi:hypothetical protein
LAADPQVSVHQELLQARTEMRLQGAVWPEPRAVRQERHLELGHAVEPRTSDLPPAELRQVLTQPKGRRMERQEHLPDAAAEQRLDERHREQQSAQQCQFQRQA